MKIVVFDGSETTTGLHSTPTPITRRQCPPQFQPTIRLRYPPFASSTHHSNPASFAIRAVFDVKLLCLMDPATTTGLHSAPMPTTRLQRPPLGCNAHHSAPTPTICLRHPPLGYNAHHSDPTPNIYFRHPPLGSNAHHSAPTPTSRLQHSLFASSAHHSTPATLAIRAVFNSEDCCLCRFRRTPLGSTRL